MFNEELLIEVLGWQAESSKEKEQITPNLLEKLAQISTELLIEEDTHGNIYVTKGKADLYPCIVSHLDQVHKFAPDKTIIKNGDYLLAFDGNKQVGTGGDDLVGVFMCLNLLDTTDAIKVAFFVQEEIGCIGSSACDLSFFADCMFIGQADRKGNADFINYSNSVKLFDEEFSNFVAPILNNYSYKECTGIATDVGALSKKGVGIACFNISCGYHEPHSRTEYVVITEVETCYNLISDIIITADKQYTYTRPTPVYAAQTARKDKSPLYTALYEQFKKHPKYIKSNKMSFAYSLVLDFVVELVNEYDLLVDDAQPDYPYMSDMLEEFLDHKNEQEPFVAAPPIQSIQTSLFANCQHKNVKFDKTMEQFYCMDCFDYVDDKDTFYDQETLGLHTSRPGYY